MARFVDVTLAAPRRTLPELERFYGGTLGLGTAVAPDRLALRVGETQLRLAPADGAPFYHVALLVPGDRFGAALAWARERVALLPARTSGDVVFDFPAWEAQACYFEDPAGSIVELIAHGGIAESGRDGGFSAEELVGLSEVGLVGDGAAMAATLERELGLPVWDGSADGRSLAFVGERARTLILAPPGRGWLPTGRPSEPHPVSATIAGTRTAEAELEHGLHRLRTVA